MITWIQVTFQKHFRILFAALLVVVVVTFVLTIGNQSFFGSGSGQTRLTRNFYGYDLANDRQRGYIEGLASLSVNLNPELVPQAYVQRGQMGQQVDTAQYALFRTAGLALADQVGLPQPSDEELRSFIRGRMMFQGEDGNFSAQRYRELIDILQLRGTPETAVRDVLRQDYRLDKLREIAGGPGFVLPFEAQAVDAEQRTRWSVDTARSTLADFQPDLQPTDEDLQQFYQLNPAQFEQPAALRVTAVRFSGERYVGEVTPPSDAELRAYFERNKPRYQEPAPEPLEGEEPQPPAEPVFENVSDRVAQDLLLERARRVAQQHADAYTVDLWRGDVKKGSPRALELAREKGANITQIEPFTRQNPPRNSPVPAQQLAAAWNLANNERFYTDVAVTAEGAAVLLVDEVIPGRQPDFSEVRAAVEQAWRAQRTRELFVEQGIQLRQQIVDAMQSGSSFADAAASLGLTVEQHADFTLEEIPTALRFWPGEFRFDDSPMTLALSMPEGQVSPMRTTATDGVIVHVARREVPPPAEGQDSSETLAGLREVYSSFNGQMLIHELATKRIEELDAEMERLQR